MREIIKQTIKKWLDTGSLSYPRLTEMLVQSLKQSVTSKDKLVLRGILRLLHEDTGQSIASKEVLRHLYLKIAGFELEPKKITRKDLKKAWGRK